MTASDPFSSSQLTPSQRALLRLVCWVAMADGDFADQERQLLEKLVARTRPGEAYDTAAALAATTPHQSDLEALVAELGSGDARQQAVKLAFQMACINQRPGDAAAINSAEKRAYRRLVDLLQLSEQEVAEAEWAAGQELRQKPSLLALIRGALGDFGAWPALDGSDLPPGYWL
jgi:uncharacterized tellurite resistance protein B-like protein